MITQINEISFFSYHQKNSSAKHPVLINLLDNNNQTQHRSTNLESLSSMYGSDFFYPTTVSPQQKQQQQHEYDNITFPQTIPSHHYDPFPILVDCQRCCQSLDRSLLRDSSCQVPSDDEYQRTNEQSIRKYQRSSPVYLSPVPTPPLCQPPLANSLLAAYHLRRRCSFASTINLHNRSKSAPSAATSSSTLSSMSSRNKYLSEKRNKHLLPSLSPLQTVPDLSQSGPVSTPPSTTALLRSIKTSIYAMKKRLKDIRRLSEVGICC